MAYKTLQNPDLYGMGNDYEQDMKYVVEKDENGKTTWRDGIYTKLAYDIKDPEGYNKRSVNVPQDKWGEAPIGLSGETDGSALFTSGYATAVSFGQPFSATSAVSEKVFKADTDAYYKDEDITKVPQGIDVASFRPVASKKDVDETV